MCDFSSHRDLNHSLDDIFDIFMTVLWPELSYYGTRALVAILDIDEHVGRTGGEYTGSDTGGRQ